MEEARFLSRRRLGLALLLGLAASACVSADPGPRKAVQTAEAAPAPAAPAMNPWAGPAREVLRAPCGRCHQGDLPSSLPAALAIYNLSEDPWYSRLSPEQYDGLLRRVRGSGSISEPDKAVVESFVRCARDGACEQSGS
jgi:cytochrome c5